MFDKNTVHGKDTSLVDERNALRALERHIRATADRSDQTDLPCPASGNNRTESRRRRLLRDILDRASRLSCHPDRFHAGQAPARLSCAVGWPCLSVMRRRKLDVLHSLKAKVKRQARREELLPPVRATVSTSRVKSPRLALNIRSPPIAMCSSTSTSLCF